MQKNPPYQIQQFGQEQEPIIVIDNFFSDPEKLVNHASQATFNNNTNYYPGVRALAPSAYLAERQDTLENAIKNTFNISAGVSLIESNFSIVTFKPSELSAFQCYPHFDGLERGRLAVLHYLCDEQNGGTAFYRHRATGFETLNTQRYAVYDAQRQKEFKKTGLVEKKYFSGNSEEFEQIGRIEAQYNRLIIYRGCSIHSGQIPENFNYSNNPKTGRLTINTFLMDKAQT